MFKTYYKFLPVNRAVDAGLLGPTYCRVGLLTGVLSLIEKHTQGKWSRWKRIIPSVESLCSHKILLFGLFHCTGMAADIVEFLSEGNLEGANCDRKVTISILAIWTVSVMQFPFHGDGEQLKRSSIVSTLARRGSLMEISCFNRLFNFEVWSIFAIVAMQDGPFLGMRVYLIYLYGISDQSLVFFSAKNVLVLMLQFYRIVALLCLETDAYGRTSLRWSKKVRNLRKTVRNLGGWGGNQDDSEAQNEDDAEKSTTEEHAPGAGANGYDNQFQVTESPTPGEDENYLNGGDTNQFQVTESPTPGDDENISYGGDAQL